MYDVHNSAVSVQPDERVSEVQLSDVAIVWRAVRTAAIWRAETKLSFWSRIIRQVDIYGSTCASWGKSS